MGRIMLVGRLSYATCSVAPERRSCCLLVIVAATTTLTLGLDPARRDRPSLRTDPGCDCGTRCSGQRVSGGAQWAGRRDGSSGAPT